MKVAQTISNDLEQNSLALKAELISIIEQQNINTLFQPIFDIENKTVFAYEALSRGPADSVLFQPDMLFEVAYHHQMASELDYICRRKAVDNFVARNIPGKLALNICPSVLVNPDFRSGRTMQMLNRAGLHSERVILELTEHQQTDIYRLKQSVNYYRDLGFSIAMDDLGAGYSNLRLLAELQPDFLKLDKYFVSGIRSDCVEADFVKLIVDLAARVGCKVIAEGIETDEDLIHVHSMGVDYGQGYLLGRPQEQAVIAVPDILLTTDNSRVTTSAAAKNSHANNTTLYNHEQVGSLSLRATEPCSSSDKLTAVLHRFQANPKLQALPVVDDGKVSGTVIRDQLFNEFSKPFAHSLYHRAPVSKLMLEQPLVVQTEDSISRASQLATRRPFDYNTPRNSDSKK